MWCHRFALKTRQVWIKVQHNNFNEKLFPSSERCNHISTFNKMLGLLCTNFYKITAIYSEMFIWYKKNTISWGLKCKVTYFKQTWKRSNFQWTNYSFIPQVSMFWLYAWVPVPCQKNWAHRWHLEMPPSMEFSSHSRALIEKRFLDLFWSSGIKMFWTHISGLIFCIFIVNKLWILEITTT